MRANSFSKEKQYKKRGMFQLVWHQLRKNKGAMIGLVIIILFSLIALTADLWIDYETQVIAQNMKEAKQWPSLEHPFGTDKFGRDIFWRLLYGAKSSLSVGFIAVAIAVLIGVPLGAVAGFYGGRVDNIIMRASDIFSSIPNLLMGIVLVSAFGQSLFSLMMAVGLTSVPAFIIGTRTAVLTARNQEYVESARAIGMSDFKIIFFQVLPNCLSQVIVRITLRIGSAIISASALSFLGLGVPAPAPEWGGMLSDGREFIRSHSYMTMFPGLAIMLVVIAFNMFGDGLRDAMDPKLKN